jgi:hypothetical protein
MVFPNQLAEVPEGRPVTVPIPVAPVVVKVTAVIAEPIQTTGSEDGAVTVLFGVIVIVPAALTVPQPPVRGMV